MTKAELWESRIAEFKASGQTAKAWCAAQELKVHQLYYWFRKFKSENKYVEKELQWLSVEIGALETTEPQEALPIRVGKATIEVRRGFDPQLLLDVVKTLSVL